MIVFGLTGSIGMGKSTAAKMLRLMGVPVHDSDRAVHAALRPNGTAYEKVMAAFPETYDKKKRLIDRKKLGDIVFHDKAALKKLEAILHPVALASQQKFIEAMQAKGKKAAVLEIPLLFETGAQSRVDYTICVTAPPEVQKRRVMGRRNMNEEKFQRILESQMPDKEKQALADFVVQTGMGYGTTFRQLRKILKETGI
jgi:dephospho-CoA kinase